MTLFAERFASCVELTPFNEKHKSPSSQSRTGVKERNLDYSSRSVQKMSEYKNSRILFFFLGNNRRGGSFASFVGFLPKLSTNEFKLVVGIRQTRDGSKSCAAAVPLLLPPSDLCRIYETKRVFKSSSSSSLLFVLCSAVSQEPAGRHFGVCADRSGAARKEIKREETRSHRI